MTFGEDEDGVRDHSENIKAYRRLREIMSSSSPPPGMIGRNTGAVNSTPLPTLSVKTWEQILRRILEKGERRTLRLYWTAFVEDHPNVASVLRDKMNINSETLVIFILKIATDILHHRIKNVEEDIKFLMRTYENGRSLGIKALYDRKGKDLLLGVIGALKNTRILKRGETLKDAWKCSSESVNLLHDLVLVFGSLDSESRPYILRYAKGLRTIQKDKNATTSDFFEFVERLVPAEIRALSSESSLLPTPETIEGKANIEEIEEEEKKEKEEATSNSSSSSSGSSSKTYPGDDPAALSMKKLASELDASKLPHPGAVLAHSLSVPIRVIKHICVVVYSTIPLAQTTPYVDC
eukprot:jgi/Bigna1/76986/fgenesh1_pg.45_\